jgi:hypothetical protein
LGCAPVTSRLGPEWPGRAAGAALVRGGRMARAEGLRRQPDAALAPAPTGSCGPAAEMAAFESVYPPKNFNKHSSTYISITLG